MELRHYLRAGAGAVTEDDELSDDDLAALIAQLVERLHALYALKQRRRAQYKAQHGRVAGMLRTIERNQRIVALRREGLTDQQIAERFGLRASYIREIRGRRSLTAVP